jgi:PAS domain S-box-containing protein
MALSEDLLASIPDPVIGFDAELRIVYWSPAAEMTYGFTAQEAVGRRTAALLRTGFPMPLTEILETVRDTGRWQGEIRQHTKDGRELTLQIRWVSRYDDHSNVLGGLTIERERTVPREEVEREHDRVRAETDRDRLLSSLGSAQRLESVGQLASAVAHDFNNMLAVIINYVAFVSAELETVHHASGEQELWASIRGDVNEIQVAAERATALTHQLLAFSSQDVAEPVPIDLNDSIRAVQTLLQRTLGDEIKLVTTLAGDLRPIRADPAQLEQVLVNLALNCRDAMPDGGTLTIDTTNIEVDADHTAPDRDLLPGRYIRLRVSDTGVGMSPEVVEHAFDPFFTTKPVGQGTGLGLASVREIIWQMGGLAQFYSGPGVGTIFSALIPVAHSSALVESQNGRVAGRR